MEAKDANALFERIVRRGTATAGAAMAVEGCADLRGAEPAILDIGVRAGALAAVEQMVEEGLLIVKD